MLVDCLWGEMRWKPVSLQTLEKLLQVENSSSDTNEKREREGRTGRTKHRNVVRVVSSHYAHRGLHTPCDAAHPVCASIVVPDSTSAALP